VLRRSGAGEDAEEMRAALASGLVSLAEGLLADAAPEVDSVAEEVHALLARAIQADARSPEPLQVRACAFGALAVACMHHQPMQHPVA
jgi:hypothetical protein